MLAGLLDSDGSLSNKNTTRQAFEFSQVDEDLIDQVMLLCQNLGFKVVKSERILKRGYYGQEINPRIVYRLRICGDIHLIPTKLIRKQASKVEHRKNYLRTSIKVEEVSTGEYFGFKLKEDPLFLLEDGTITHNCSNLIDIYSNTKDNLREGLRKTGTLMMLGTGGDMESGTLAAHEMFYEPEAYDILPFEDTWEQRGNIAFFVPAYMALNQYKDERGFSKTEEALKALNKAREKAKTGSGGSEALNKEIQYRPVVPSEIFLTKSSTIFPTAELRRTLSEVALSSDLYEKKVQLFFDPDSPYNGVNYHIDPNLVPINKFP